MGRFHSLAICCSAVSVIALVPCVQAQSEDMAEGEAFQYEERSTLETIKFDSIEEETLANTVIEGGLEAPAAGVPLRPISADDDADSYMDPLALDPRDRRTDQDRSELPAEYFLNLPRDNASRPVNNLPVNLPSNRTYQTLNINMTERP